MVSTSPASESATIRCPQCGAANRVSQEQVDRGLAPVCGRCQAPLPAVGGAGGADTGKPITVTDATFAPEVERSPVPVLVDFWAPWCPPCRMIAPVIDELASEMGGRVRFAKVNIDENQATAGRFRVASIPTLVVFKDGREVDRIVGVQPKQAIAQRLRRLVT
jgi:thioredoxin 2